MSLKDWATNGWLKSHKQGYRPEKNLAHYRTLMALPLILGSGRDDDATHLDVCRAMKWNTNISVASLWTILHLGLGICVLGFFLYYPGLNCQG